MQSPKNGGLLEWIRRVSGPVVRMESRELAERLIREARAQAKIRAGFSPAAANNAD